MKKITRAPVEVFNLSFLDIISCAFGAVVMLVLLSKNGDEIAPPDGDADGISVLIDQLLAAKQSSENLQGALSNQQDQLASAKANAGAASDQLENLEQDQPKALKTLKQLEDKANSIRDEIAQANALLNVPVTTTKPDKDVGGVPTDADYVVFIVDNSGSMHQIGWNKIIATVRDVLDNHPEVKGFNIMSASADYISMKPRGWIKDSKNNRRLALAELKGFGGGGSTPEVGIMEAITRYKATKGKVSLYVFGDEYSSRSIEATVEQITNANWDSVRKQPRFRIHGIGFFFNGGSATRVGFAAFMKSVATHNRGAFIALDV